MSNAIRRCLLEEINHPKYVASGPPGRRPKYLYMDAFLPFSSSSISSIPSNFKLIDSRQVRVSKNGISITYTYGSSTISSFDRTSYHPGSICENTLTHVQYEQRLTIWYIVCEFTNIQVSCSQVIGENSSVKSIDVYGMSFESARSSSMQVDERYLNYIGELMPSYSSASSYVNNGPVLVQGIYVKNSLYGSGWNGSNNCTIVPAITLKTNSYFGNGYLTANSLSLAYDAKLYALKAIDSKDEGVLKPN